jgi:hypothetical protein
MRSPIEVLTGKVGGFTTTEVARRTVPCYKHVIEKDGERLALCILVDSGKLYRFPYETVKPMKGPRAQGALPARGDGAPQAS